MEFDLNSVSSWLLVVLAIPSAYFYYVKNKNAPKSSTSNNADYRCIQSIKLPEPKRLPIIGAYYFVLAISFVYLLAGFYVFLTQMSEAQNVASVSDILSTFVLLLGLFGLPVYFTYDFFITRKKLIQKGRSKTYEEAEIILNMSISKVFEKSCAALVEMGARIIYADRPHALKAQKNRSYFTVDISKYSNNQTKIVIGCDSVWLTTTSDQGDNRRYLITFSENLRL